MLPDPDRFAASLLARAQRLPRGGGYRFTPGPRAPHSANNPRDAEHDGVSAALLHADHTFARPSAGGETYCCGVTLEAFWRAWTLWCEERGRPVELAGLDAAGLDALVATWFCPTMGHAGAAAAIVELGLGAAIAPEHARAGDLCQFWRCTDLAHPSGHSVLFLRWGDRDGTRTIRYWSSQPATDGIGEHEEAVGPDWTFAFARVGQR